MRKGRQEAVAGPNAKALLLNETGMKKYGGISGLEEEGKVRDEDTVGSVMKDHAWWQGEDTIRATRRCRMEDNGEGKVQHLDSSSGEARGHTRDDPNQHQVRPVACTWPYCPPSFFEIEVLHILVWQKGVVPTMDDCAHNHTPVHSLPHLSPSPSRPRHPNDV